MEDERVYYAGNEHFCRWGQMRFALVMKTLVLETNTLQMHIQTSATQTQLVTSDFQTELILR